MVEHVASSGAGILGNQNGACGRQPRTKRNEHIEQGPTRSHRCNRVLAKPPDPERVDDIIAGLDEVGECDGRRHAQQNAGERPLRHRYLGAFAGHR